MHIVSVPTAEFSNFNFKGKLLGPKGMTLKKLEETTKCRIQIRGRGSVRSAEEEEVKRTSGDPAFRHLQKEIHVVVTAVAPPVEAYSMMASALRTLKEHLKPDKFDKISQDKFKELVRLNPEYNRNQCKQSRYQPYHNKRSK
ncbi:KH domain-containing, RNA-binding, signal transduction-associated protein 2-like isoform X2 [Musca autumnalis]|uniref:KH domain-containing, RNA-binding, signal transduction-associated protein 2-like isoform X2 n=1 Tax=Musca autumnalis TaxID=221902 RepID=UPI003CF37AB8